MTQNVPGIRNYTTPIVMDGVNCRGREATLGQCLRDPVVENCLHEDDVGANCTNIKGVQRQ